jgi:hypothetical protein
LREEELDDLQMPAESRPVERRLSVDPCLPHLDSKAEEETHDVGATVRARMHERGAHELRADTGLRAAVLLEEALHQVEPAARCRLLEAEACYRFY